jgi:ribonuclease HIII
VFNRVFPIHVQGTDVCNVTSDLIKLLSKCHLQTRKATNRAGPILNTTVNPTKCNIRTVNGVGADEVGAGAYRH